MGSLCAKNVSEKFSRLGTFKQSIIFSIKERLLQAYSGWRLCSGGAG
jgi:hypothetical protein